MSMNPKNVVALAVAWCGTLAQVTIAHLSMLLSILCAGFAIVASIYSILLSRDRRRRGRAHDLAMCEVCRETFGNEAECPYPEEERPDNCWKKRILREDEGL